MASSVKQMPFFFFLVAIILSSSSLHIALARDFQSFNKIPSTTTKNVVVPEKEQQADDQPTFLPQNEESYGLYGHETGQLPPSATTTDSKPKYLPKNYNTVAYVTVPENTNEDKTTSDDDGLNEETSFGKNPNNAKTSNYGEENVNYYDNERQHQKDEDFSEYSNSNYDNNRLGSDFNSPRETRFTANNGGDGLKRQGMSDTRFLENGKYHYSLSIGRFSSNHPYETLKGSVFSDNNADDLGRTNENNVFNAEDNNYVDDDGERFQENEDRNLP